MKKAKTVHELRSEYEKDYNEFENINSDILTVDAELEELMLRE